MSDPAHAPVGSVSSQPATLSAPPSLDQLQASFAAFTPRYRAAIQDPTSIKPLLIPADTYFTPRCSVCAASFSTITLLEAHVRAIHPSFYASAQHASQLANAVSPASAPSAHDAAYLPPWLRPGDPLVPCPAPVTNATAQQLPVVDMQQPTPVVAKPDTLQYRCQLCNVSCDTMAMFTIHSAGQKHRKKADLFNAFKRAEKRFPSESIRFEQPCSWHCELCATSMHAHNEVLQHLECAKHKRLLHAAHGNSSSSRVAAHNMPVTAIKPPAVSAAMAVMQSPVTENTSSTLSASRQQSDPAMQTSPASATITLRGTIAKPTKNSKTVAYACSVCNVTCTSNDNLNVHLASARHRRKVEGSASNNNIVCNVCQITVSGAANYEAHLKGKAHAKKQQQRHAAAENSASALLSIPPSAASANPNQQPDMTQPNASDPLQALRVPSAPVPHVSDDRSNVRPPIALPVQNPIPFRSVPYPKPSSREQS